MRASLERPLLAAALLATATGCSLIAVRRPPAIPTDAPLECTQSRAAPGLDTAGAIATPLFGLMLWGLCSYTSAMQSWSSDPTRIECGPVIWGTVLATAAYTGSAVYGFRETGECRRLAAARSAVGPPRP
jgi:hypothetical protein